MERAPATVDSEVRSACAKLCATTRLQAAVIAARSAERDALTVPCSTVADVDADGRRLLELLAEGSSLAVAAKSVHMSRRTATRRLACVRFSLGVATTSEAILALFAMTQQRCRRSGRRFERRHRQAERLSRSQ